MEKKQILHITPHLGGGVGKVLLNYFAKNNKNFTHQVACLDCVSREASKKAKGIGLKVFEKMYGQNERLCKMVAKSDIVVVHWWNHPLLYDFLVRNKLEPCRLVVWSHISGLYPPAIFTKKILRYPDFFVFTTPVSLKTKEVLESTANGKNNFRVVWATGGIDNASSTKHQKHMGFNIGYIGTVDYAKLHPNFLKICEKIDIPQVKFIVCGGPNEREIKKEAEKMGIAGKFNFTGQILNIKDYFSVFDILGYPLSPYHYGTCDQTLQESMAAGIVPVVLNNPMENYMVKNGVTGIVAKTESDYIKGVHSLYKNKDLRKTLSKNAKKYAFENFSLKKMIIEWDKILNEALNLPKTAKKWDLNKKNILAHDVFLESLGAYGKFFEDKNKIIKMAESPNWQSQTKGTVCHYHHFFPNDHQLSVWCELMKKN